MNAIDFCYQHFGRYVAPGSRLDWLSYGSLGKEGKGKQGGRPDRFVSGALVIRENGIVASGVVPVSNDALSVTLHEGKINELVQGLLFNPPEEPWVGVSFGKRGLPIECITLNSTRQCAQFLQYIKPKYELVRVMPGILREAADGVGDFPANKLRDLWRVHQKNHLQQKNLNDKETKLLRSARSHVTEALHLLQRYGMSPEMLEIFLKWRKSHA